MACSRIAFPTAQEQEKEGAAEAVEGESEGSAPGGCSPCGKAGLHLRPLGGLVGVDCSVCMVITLSGPAQPGFFAHKRSAARACLSASLPACRCWLAC